MKKAFILVLSIFIGGQIIAQSSDQFKIRLFFTWDHWGHGERCRGGGLCNFRLINPFYSPITEYPNKAEVFQERDGTMYALIPYDKNMEKEDQNNGLIVDKDLIFIDKDSNLFTIKASIYPINFDLIKSGCYKVNIVKNK
jgi:hypothetical protein